jgi:hypothetical protein
LKKVEEDLPKVKVTIIGVDVNLRAQVIVTEMALRHILNSNPLTKRVPWFTSRFDNLFHLLAFDIFGVRLPGVTLFDNCSDAIEALREFGYSGSWRE